MKRCETFDHTADVGLSAEASTLRELMEALAEGLAEVICARRSVYTAESFDVTVQAEDIEALVVDYLGAVLNAIQADHFLVHEVRVERASKTFVSAELMGEWYSRGRHELKTEVKAVTYHQLKVAREGRRWVARVILDL